MGKEAQLRPRAGMGAVAVAVAAAAAAIAAAPASAALHNFEGDRGTSCTVEVGAKASDSLGALSGPPQVGYSAVPQCTYAAGAGGPKGAKGKRKGCRKGKRAGKGKRRCKKARRRSVAYATPARAVAPELPRLAVLDHARLELLGPSGEVTSVAGRTMAAPPIGYSCALSVGTPCSDSGRLVPALPGVSYVAEFGLRLAPPPGESWVSRPAGCTDGLVATCALRSGAVSPQI
jgi:hypothetical protein